jgi:hypothetical protein
MILTIAVPAAHVADANQYAMALGYGIADAKTYGAPSWQDAEGGVYSVASYNNVTSAFIEAFTAPLERPAWDTENDINMTGANRAQDLVNFWMVNSEDPTPQVNPNEIIAICGISGLVALAAIGLNKVPEDI